MCRKLTGNLPNSGIYKLILREFSKIGFFKLLEIYTSIFKITQIIEEISILRRKEHKHDENVKLLKNGFKGNLLLEIGVVKFKKYKGIYSQEKPREYIIFPIRISR